MTTTPRRPSDLLARHRDSILTVARRHKAVDVKVFGSVARGEDRPGSDLDLLVRFATDASLFDQARLAQDLEDLLGIRVDVISDGASGGRLDAIRTEARPL